jgi:hypothetical protein
MNRKSLKLKISSNGTITAIYDDSLAGLLACGHTTITRASAVEPSQGGWTADMSPIEPGCVLGPYKLRSEALDAEVAWLQEHIL